MKISLNWLLDFIDIELSINEISTLLTDIGLEVEAVESYETYKNGLKGLVVGEVLEKTKHPDADKLSVCKVSTGTEVLQIVCGAPNVAVQQKVVVALVDTMLYPKNAEPFQIKKSKIRGVESFGMLCAEDEIGIGSSHDGIIVLDNTINVGTPVAELYQNYSDTIFEIGLTPNRSDAYSHYGVARDLLAAYNFRYQKNKPLKKQATTTLVNSSNTTSIEVIVENKTDCPKYTGIVLSNIRVTTSPMWLQNKLKAIGQQPINSVVDVTNYVLHEIGQPLHAFDLTAIKGNKVIVKNIADKTPFVCLDGKEIKLNTSDLMICNENDAMCIAGVYGGLLSGVNANTTSIFLESAYFNPKAIRKTATSHQLRTEAAMHFEKGIDPNITVYALERAVALLQTINPELIITSNTILVSNQEFTPYELSLNLDRLNQLAGLIISRDDVKKILQLLDINISNEQNEVLYLTIPRYRVDVTREADVIEEVLRIYGFNNIPIPSKINASINIENKKSEHQIYEAVANYLVGLGSTEIMTNPLTKSKLNEKINASSSSWVHLLSSINAELDVLRNSLIFSALEAVSYNLNHKNNQIQFFELGKTYQKNENNFEEEELLILCCTGNEQIANWKKSQVISDFFRLKSLVTALLQKLGIQNYLIEDSSSSIWEYGLSYKYNNKNLVSLGAVQHELNKLFSIKQQVFYAEFNWKLIVDIVQNNKTNYQVVAKFPTVKRDLALQINDEISFEQIKTIAQKVAKSKLQHIDIFDIYKDEKLGANQKSYAVSFVFKDDTKTLQDSEIDNLMQKLLKEFNQQLNATVR